MLTERKQFSEAKTDLDRVEVMMGGRMDGWMDGLSLVDA